MLYAVVLFIFILLWLILSLFLSYQNNSNPGQDLVRTPPGLLALDTMYYFAARYPDAYSRVSMTYLLLETIWWVLHLKLYLWHSETILCTMITSILSTSLTSKSLTWFLKNLLMSILITWSVIYVVHTCFSFSLSSTSLLFRKVFRLSFKGFLQITVVKQYHVMFFLSVCKLFDRSFTLWPI